jgi:hypothetical protein
VSQPTARDYLHIAHHTFLWHHLPPWSRAMHDCPYGLIINNDETPRLLDERILSIPATHL